MNKYTRRVTEIMCGVCIMNGVVVLIESGNGHLLCLAILCTLIAFQTDFK